MFRPSRPGIEQKPNIPAPPARSNSCAVAGCPVPLDWPAPVAPEVDCSPAPMWEPDHVRQPRFYPPTETPPAIRKGHYISA